MLSSLRQRRRMRRRGLHMPPAALGRSSARSLPPRAETPQAEAQHVLEEVFGYNTPGRTAFIGLRGTF